MNSKMVKVMDDAQREKLYSKVVQLLVAVDDLLSIGKRDLSNPKYDEYWKSLMDARQQLLSLGVEQMRGTEKEGVDGI